MHHQSNPYFLWVCLKAHAYWKYQYNKLTSGCHTSKGYGPKHYIFEKGQFNFLPSPETKTVWIDFILSCTITFFQWGLQKQNKTKNEPCTLEYHLENGSVLRCPASEIFFCKSIWKSKLKRYFTETSILFSVNTTEVPTRKAIKIWIQIAKCQYIFYSNNWMWIKWRMKEKERSRESERENQVSK